MGEFLYQGYRGTTLGVALKDTLDELIAQNAIGPNLEEQIKVQFDRSIAHALENAVKKKASFAGGLHTYRNCNDVWVMDLRDVKFVTDSGEVKCDAVRIVASDSKKSSKSTD